MMSQMYPALIHNLIYLKNIPVHHNHLGDPSNWYGNLVLSKLSQMEERIMSKKNSSTSGSKPEWQVTFVQLKLNEQTAADFTKWMERKEP